jgi:hypothetical protein
MLLQFPMYLNLEPYTLEGIAKAESGDAATASQACLLLWLMSFVPLPFCSIAASLLFFKKIMYH